MRGQDTESLDLTKIAALQQKRTLAFVNHYTLSTIQFINIFAKECEEKLMTFERKLEKINATMVLLEARLSSIPEINPSTEPTSKQEVISDSSNDNNNNELEDTNHDINHAEQNLSQTEISSEYERFVKMVHVGVPIEAVKLKLSLEGLDVHIFEQILGK
ncbi:WASH complex subunit 3 [Aricia agestis]|uniref:WASH complex subunit 3 n=1 Tax=Aricia agestis TaxID=91739 RepID=UPI001C20864F|nr:WASH complex subunit 3 [Aricia agestis]